MADRLTISIRSVRNLIRDGRLPIVRVTSRRVAIAESDLQSFVDARRSDREGATT
ncbi:MAG: helix-turn-helix domain-containing protein [Planctomycetes bacterium]|nr:helix-turn-helix domain-containing protein [Planctomycetota bacterium]